MWQDINLSDFGLVRYMVAGGQGAWPHWAPVQGPSTPTVLLGEWPTWPRLCKWHKWALQPVKYLWHYILGLFAVLYICCLIIYSCTQCKEMLYGLSSLQTNLHIYFHHQSDVLLHQGTTFVELLLSTEIRNAMGKSLKKVHLSSGQPDLTEYQWWPLDGSMGVCLSSGQLGLTSYQSLPPDASAAGYIWPQVSLTQRLTTCHADLM